MLKNLKNKSENEKKIILILVVGVLMIFVCFVWFIQMKINFQDKDTPEELLPEASVLIEAISDTYGNSVEKIEEIKQNLGEYDIIKE